MKDLFISYGRRESLGLVARLQRRLKLAGYDAWFDKVNIPDGEDYAQRINYGIESAHNFICVMAPRCLTSPYCLVELEYARFLGKRVIPLNQMVIFQVDSPQELSPGDRQVLTQFYQQHHLPVLDINTNQAVLARSLALIGPTDWLAAQEHLSHEDCQKLTAWAQPYENQWYQHEDLDYLQQHDLPIFGQVIDELDSVVERLITVLERQTTYVQQHTQYLLAARHWETQQRQTVNLLVGKEYETALAWLLQTDFGEDQPPCTPSPLHAEYISEAKKIADNFFTDIFIAYADEDQFWCDEIVAKLACRAITVWQHDKDIQSGIPYDQAIRQGIEQAEALLFFISPRSVQSAYCLTELDYAVQLNKRIMPLLFEVVSTLPAALQSLQDIDFTNNYHSAFNTLLRELATDKEYYQKHTALLAAALKWQAQEQNAGVLLRGFNLNQAETWLTQGLQRSHHQPTALHEKFIQASLVNQGQLQTEVFISYSRKDSGFARRLNAELQNYGKTTWFDQESIAEGTDFEKEIYKGIDNTDNFVFIISPDAVQSEFCAAEVAYAAETQKRFIPLLYRDPQHNPMPPALAAVQWLQFQPAEKEFATAFRQLLRVLDTDREHVQAHTRWAQKAQEWFQSNQNVDFLLSESESAQATEWLQIAEQEQKTPLPTQLQQQFITQSQAKLEANRRRDQRRVIVLSGLLIVAVVALVVAISQFFKTQKLARESLVQKLSAQAILSAHLPDPVSGDITRGSLLALAAIQLEDNVETRGNFLHVLGEQPQLATTLYSYIDMVWGVSFSPDDKQLAAANSDNTVRLWDVQTHQPLGEPLLGHTDMVSGVSFSPDGKQLASASSDNTVRLWDVQTHQPLGKPLLGHTDKVLSICFSPDGKQLASASLDNTVRLWNVQSHQPLGKPLRGHTDRVMSVSFSPDGKQLASASDDNTIRLWDVQTQQLLGEPLRGHNAPVWRARFSPDGRLLASASSDNTVRLWDVQTQQQLGEPLRGHIAEVLDVSFSTDGQRLASTSSDSTIRLWNIQTHQPLGEPLRGHTAAVWNVNFSSDGKQLATASLDGTVRLWEVENRQLLGKPLYKNTTGIKSVSFSPNGKQLAIASSDHTVRLWDVQTQQPLGKPLHGHTNKILSINFSPDGKQLASASSDSTVRLWDVQTQQALGEPLRGHTGTVLSVSFSPDGKQLASAGSDNTIRLWNIQTHRPQGEPLRGHTDRVMSVSFSPDGKQLASASSDKTVRRWDVQTHQPLGKSLLVNALEVRTISFSPDGKQMAFTSFGDTISLWDVQTHQLLGKPLHGHTARIWSISFSPDGKYLASASSDNTVRLWDVQTQQPLGEPLRGHTATVWNISFSPNGKQLASASEDGTVILWDVDLSSWLKKACRRANRNLTQVEWQRYLGGRSYQPTCKQYPSDVALTKIATGEKLAQQGDIQAAITTFKSVLAKEPLLNFDPQVRARQIAVQSQLERVEQLAKEDNPQEIITDLQQMKQWDKTLDFDPQTQAKKLILQAKLIKGEQLAQQPDKLQEAIDEFQKAIALDDTLNFNPEIKAKQILAQKKRTLGEEQARNNDIPAAITSFKQAIDLDQNLNLNPELKAKQLAAQALYFTAVQFARIGRYQKSVTAFQSALKLDTTLNFDPETRFQAIAAVAQGEQQAKQGEIISALDFYKTAAGSWEIPAYAWERLCRWGSLRGHADQVNNACENAVTLEPDQPHFRDSRGLARALTGDTQGAIEDFQFYIDHLFWKYGQQQRQAWIKMLKKGENPLTKEVLRALIQEEIK
ncbi:MAG: TIR domain-containing protein [Thioploca sp.]|nr:TIR domain-containing protein [Thioploca sp.]